MAFEEEFGLGKMNLDTLKVRFECFIAGRPGADFEVFARYGTFCLG
jgi:hypothetical protein